MKALQVSGLIMMLLLFSCNKNDDNDKAPGRLLRWVVGLESKGSDEVKTTGGDDRIYYQIRNTVLITAMAVFYSN